MKSVNLKTVCDSALKDELEKRGYYVQYISKNINDWKYPNKIIELATEYGYWYLGETKEFTEKEFKKAIREFLDTSDRGEIGICKGYFKLKSYTSTTFELAECCEKDDEAIEFWRI